VKCLLQHRLAVAEVAFTNNTAGGNMTWLVDELLTVAEFWTALVLPNRYALTFNI
jgi:hypothetical protein